MAQYTIWAHAVRWLAPLAIVFLIGENLKNKKFGFTLLRWGIGITFITHGAEAIASHPQFMDLILNFQIQYLNMFMSESEVSGMLFAIGAMDILVGAITLVRPQREILLWMSFWGGITAFSRVPTLGAYYGGIEFLLRAFHVGVPVFLAFNIKSFEKINQLIGQERGESKMSLKTRFLLPARLTFLGLLLIGMSFTAYGQDYHDNLKHIRVVFGKRPASNAKIMFSSTRKLEKKVLYYDTVKRSGQLSAYKHKVNFNNSGNYFFSRERHHYKHLGKLKPKTNYYFTIVADGVQSKEYYFTTIPKSFKEAKLFFGGDSRSDRKQRQTMNKLLKQLFEADDSIYALVHGGDYVENGGSYKLWKQWLDDHQLTVRDDGRVLPIIPTRGNHEIIKAMFNDIFASPGDGENYFTTHIGDLAIVTLNTEISHTGKQLSWLESQLNELKEHKTWILGNYHRPAYPAYKTPGKSLTAWVPIFDQYGLDLVFESDGHMLKRTVPIKNGREDITGTVYVGEGGLGVPMRDPEKKKGEWYLQSPGYVTNKHHVQLLTITPNKLVYEVILPDGVMLDHLELFPRERQKNAPIPRGSFVLKSRGFKTCFVQPGHKSEKAYHSLCKNTKDQIFSTGEGDEGYLKIVNDANKCMTFSSFGRVKFKRCDGDDDQLFAFVDKSADKVEVINKNNGKCLEFKSSGHTEDNKRFFSTRHKSCDGSQDQAFVMLD